jgi:hypothetical protein
MRYKLLMLLLLGMFLVGLVSATPTVTLNSPLDSSIINVNSVTFNATGSVSTGKEYIKQSSLCSNITGTWTCSDTLNSLDSITISSDTTMCGEYFYENFTITNSATVTVCSYNGTIGTGMLKINAVNINIESGSKINADGKGYRGATTNSPCLGGGSREGVSGEGTGAGGGAVCFGGSGSGAGGSGYGNTGGNGGREGTQTAGAGGSSYGSNSALDLLMGSGGGSGALQDYSNSIAGGNGGGGIYLNALNMNISGQLSANGNNGDSVPASGFTGGAGGGGSGGDIILIADKLNINSISMTANGGNGGAGAGTKHCEGGGGAGGRIKTVYDTSISNTSITSTVNGGLRGTPTCATNGLNGGIGTIYYNQDTYSLASEISDDKVYTTSKTISSGEVILWNVQSCDGENNCEFASSNYTFSIDSVAPTVTINAGEGTQDYGAIDINHTINFTATDTNLDKVWFNYNGTNTTITGATSGIMNSTSFALVKDLYTATIYTNDTAGNLNSETVEWNYIFFEGESSFNNFAFETALEQFAINISTSLNILTATGRLIYNGSINPVIGSCVSGLCQFNKSLDIPLVISGNSENKPFYWELSLYDGTTNYNLNTSEQQQNVSRIYLEECGGSFTTQTLNFTAYQETNLTRVNPFYIAGTFDFWLGSGTVTRNNSFNKASTSNLSLCLSPVDRTIYSDAHIEYDYTDENITYIRRNYYLDNSSLTNTSQDIELLLLENSDSTSFIIEVKDQKLSPVEDAYVYIQRYYPTDGTFRTVQVAKTDSNGETIGFYKTETVDYKHLIIQDGVVLLETTPQKVVGKTAPFTLSFTIGDPLGYPWDPFLKDSNIQSTLTYNKTSEIVTFTYIDTTGSTTLGRLVVLKESLSNYTTTVICNTSSTQSSVTLTCNMSGYSGTFNAYAYIEGESTDILSFVTTTARDIMGNEGLLLGFFIILVAGFAFIWNPSAGIIGINVAVIFVNIIGFITVSPVFIFGMIAVSFITIILLKT